MDSWVSRATRLSTRTLPVHNTAMLGPSHAPNLSRHGGRGERKNAQPSLVRRNPHKGEGRSELSTVPRFLPQLSSDSARTVQRRRDRREGDRSAPRPLTPSRRPGRNGRLGSDPWDRAGGGRQRAAACYCLCGQTSVTGRVGGGTQACNAQTDHRRLPTLADGWLLPAAAGGGLHAAGAGRQLHLTDRA